MSDPAGNVVDIRGAAAFRAPPVNLEAEKALLGAIFIQERAYRAVQGFLEPRHFAHPAHQAVYARIAEVVAGGGVADPVTLKAWAAEALADAGGASYLAELAGSAVTVINAPFYGRVIRELWVRREIAAAAAVLADDVTAGLNIEDARGQFEEWTAGLTPPGEAGPRPLVGFVDEALRRADAAHKAGGMVGLQTGLVDLDRLLGGVQGGDLVVVGGATSMGKTSFAWTVLGNLAKNGVPSLLVSLEMAGVQLALRELAAATGVPARDIRAGRADFVELAQAAAESNSTPIWIDDGARTLAAIEASARLARRKHKVAAVAVDYLQLIDHEAENRTQAVTQISGRLKNLARDLDVPLFALSQVTRGIAGRDDKRPVLSDLRESGSIEQDADAVIFLHREAYYLERAEPRSSLKEGEEEFALRLRRHLDRLEQARGIAEVIVAKNRNGPTGVVKTRFDESRMRFENAARM